MKNDQLKNHFLGNRCKYDNRVFQIIFFNRFTVFRCTFYDINLLSACVKSLVSINDT